MIFRITLRANSSIKRVYSTRILNIGKKGKREEEGRGNILLYHVIIYI